MNTKVTKITKDTKFEFLFLKRIFACLGFLVFFVLNGFLQRFA